MCEHCHELHCPTGCPGNAEEYFGECRICKSLIKKYDECVELALGDVVHLDCLVSKIEDDPREALEMLGAECYRAGE